MFVGLSVSVLLRECPVIVVCVVLSVWMSRLGNGGVSKYYAPMTAWNAQSPDHILTCYLTVHLSVSLFLSLCDSIHLPRLHVLLSPSRRPNSPRVQSEAFQTAGISPADSCSATRSPLAVFYLSAYSCPLQCYNICNQYFAPIQVYSLPHPPS